MRPVPDRSHAQPRATCNATVQRIEQLPLDKDIDAHLKALAGSRALHAQLSPHLPSTAPVAAKLTVTKLDPRITDEALGAAFQPVLRAVKGLSLHIYSPDTQQLSSPP